MDKEKAINIMTLWMNCITCDECPVAECRNCPYNITDTAMLEAVQFAIDEFKGAAI